MTQAPIFGVPRSGPVAPDVMAGRIDDNFDAQISSHSGASRPTYAVAGTIWLNTATAGLHKYYFFDGTTDRLFATVDTATGATTYSNGVSDDALSLKADIVQAYMNLASAATTDLSTVASVNVQVTGTTTITAFGTAPSGTLKRVRFNNTLTLTHNATSLKLYSTSNITTYDGLTMEFISDGSGNWREVSHTPASGAWNTGVLSQSVALTPIATSGNTGRFVKEGKKVTLWVTITASAAGTTPGSAVRVSGLPFTPDTASVAVGGQAIGAAHFYDSGSQFYTLVPYFNSPATAIEFNAQGLGSAFGAVLTIASGDKLSMQITYEAAA